MPSLAVPGRTLTVTSRSDDSVEPFDSSAVTVTGVAGALSPMVAGLTIRFTTGVRSSFLIVPVPVSVASTPAGAPETLRPTMKVSSSSSTLSSIVATVIVFVSFASPAKDSVAALAV